MDLDETLKPRTSTDSNSITITNDQHIGIESEIDDDPDDHQLEPDERTLLWEAHRLLVKVAMLDDPQAAQHMAGQYIARFMSPASVRAAFEADRDVATAIP